MRGSTAGIPENINGQNSIRFVILSILDALFSAFIVAPTVVGYWRSIWELMEYYVYPDNIFISSTISTIIGLIGHLAFGLSQNIFEKYFHPDKNRLLFLIISRIYTVCFAFVCVNGWRGPWQLLNLYTSSNIVSLIATTLVGAIALAAMRALRNCSATPFSIVTDSAKGYFEVLTMFRVPMKEQATLYVLDCLFSVLIIGTLVVFVWRGAWALLDIYLFPENEALSAWGSLVLGYGAVGIAFLLQPVMKWLCDRYTGAIRLLIADLFLIFSLIGTVNVWRGIWNLLNIYLFPDNLELSCWLTHWVCLFILISLGCSNSLLVRGVYIDAEEPAGKCVIFPCYYLRILLQQQKMSINEKSPTKDKPKIELSNMENKHVINMNQYTKKEIKYEHEK